MSAVQSLQTAVGDLIVAANGAKAEILALQAQVVDLTAQIAVLAAQVADLSGYQEVTDAAILVEVGRVIGVTESLQ
jgi:hypothetical protein